MGYCMSQMNDMFYIHSSKVEEAVKAIKGLAGKETIKGYGSYNPHFSWVIHDFHKHDDLFSLMREWRWEISYDNDNNVESILFVGEKLGDDLILFKAIAPFVEKDSFIEMQGEDGSLWRWVFDGTKCEEISPTINW